MIQIITRFRNWNKHKVSILPVLLCLLFTTNIYKNFLLNFGFPDITAILVLLTFISAFIKIIKWPKIRHDFLISFLLWGLFVGIYIVSLIYTSSEVYSIYKIREMGLIITSLIISSCFFIPNIKSFKFIMNFFAILGVILSLGSLQLVNSSLNYVSSFGLDYLVYSRYVLFGLIILLFYFDNEFKDSTKRQFVIRVFAFILLFSVLASGSMSTFMFANIIVLFWIITKLRKNVIVSLTMLLFFLVFGAFIINSGYLNTIFYKIQVYSDVGIGGARLKYLSTGIKMFAESPFIGHGIGSFPVYFNGIDVVNYPHNIIVEILAETGLLGLAIFSILVAYLLFLWKKKKYFWIGKKTMLKDIYKPLMMYFLMMVITSSIGSARLIYLIIFLPISINFYTRGEELD